MFEHQKVTIKSGGGDNYFEATAELDTMANPAQTRLIMDGLKQMQKDRMEWAANKKPETPFAQKEVASR